MIAQLLSGALKTQHRARLFPLPLVEDAVCRASLGSARSRQRWEQHRLTTVTTNRCIKLFNSLYNSDTRGRYPLFTHPHQQQSNQQPGNVPSSSPPSAAQLRLQVHLREKCAAFVKTARIRRDLVMPTCDIDTTVILADSLRQAGNELTRALHANNLRSTHTTQVVPLVASRVSLPTSLRQVPLTSVLPQHVAQLYSQLHSPALMRDPIDIWLLDRAQPLKPARVAGSRKEYVRLIHRLRDAGMVSFTTRPLAVNGVFTVGKDANSDRLIIDAQPANRLFIDSPPVSLPNASHLVQLQVPSDATLSVGKSDLSDFYHSFKLPEWMTPYFCLPSLRPEELVGLGLPPSDVPVYPMCLTLPMGFSHAVYLAQTAHEHILYGSSAVDPTDSVLRLDSPRLGGQRCLHGVYIDDFFLFSLDRHAATVQLDRVLVAYERAGFMVKASKLVRPTTDTVTVLGFSIDGACASIRVGVDACHSLRVNTLAILAADTVSGIALRRLIGSWTWVMLLRRPCFSFLQHCYKYIEVAKGRPFTLWQTVRRELASLLAVLPLLAAELRAPLFRRVIATDASELAAGMVATTRTDSITSALWPLCSDRRHGQLQANMRADSGSNPLQGLESLPAGESATVQSLADTYNAAYSAVGNTPWTVIISRAWLNPEHINQLELRTVLLALHWVLSHRDSLGQRVLLLLDSLVCHAALWKGRCSSPALLLILRKITVLLLASGVTLHPAWIPTDVNPADRSSRLLGPAPFRRPRRP